MSKVCVAVKLTLKAGSRDAFDAAVKPGLATADGEPGTLMYAYHHDGANENVVWFYEVYADQASFQAHMSTDAFKAFSASLAPMLDGAPEFSFLAPKGGKGI